MGTFGRKNPCSIIAVLSILAFAAGVPAAGDMPSYPGWEMGGAYDQYYKVSEFDRIKGTFVKVVKVAPMPGMAEGVGIIVEESGGEEVVVHLAPKGFVDPNSLGLRRGDTVKVKGVWADIDGQEVFMASKVKRGEYFEIKVRRTRDGTPYWTLTSEELAEESNPEE